MPVYVYVLVTGLTSLLFFLTGLFVYTRNTRRPLYQRCFIFSTSVSLWALGYFITLLEIPNYLLNITASRLSHAFGAFIPITYLHFVWVILKRESKRHLFFWSYLFSALMFCMSLTPLVVKVLMPKMGIQFYPEWGILYPVYSSLFLIFPGYAQFEMGREILRLKGTERTRLIYFFVALGLAFSGGISLFLLIFNIPFPPHLSMLIILYPPMMAYTILVHKFMDIEVILKKTLVFAGIVAAAVSMIAFPFALIQAVIGKALGAPNPFILMALGIVTAVFIYRPVERLLVNITDKFLFQKKINYRLLLREASEYLAHVDSLKHQARTIVAFLLKKARIANAAVYAFAAPDRSSLLLKASRPFIADDHAQLISLTHPIVEYFHHHEGPIEVHALDDIRDDKFLKPEDFKEIVNLMRSLKAEAAIPCYGGEAASKFDKKSFRLKGILFLGHQKSDEPYSEEDLDVFFTLGQESSIAFENARLYDEAINRSIELEKANEELKKTQAALMEEKKRALLAGMSSAVGHEIRSPLMPLGTHVYFSRKRLDEMKSTYEESISNSSNTSRQKFLKAMNSLYEQLSGIEICNNRIKGIVNTLLNLVRKRSEQKGAVQLELLVASAIEEVRFQTYWETLAAPKIERQIPAGLPFILGITQDLQGVFVNLIINSLHAMEKTADKKITIKARVAEDKPDMIKIEFADTGCGIPEELQEKVFEHGVTTKGEKGTGIGLFYCKDIIERVHGGTVSLKSKVGEGTCFIISLPVYKEANITSGEPAGHGKRSDH